MFKKRKKLIILSAVSLIVIGIVITIIFKKRTPPITVQTDKVTRRNLTETVVANGRIQPVVQVKINPEVSGEITDLPVREGQHVIKGDLIVKIKPDVYIANLHQTEASYQSSLAGKATAEANLRKAEADFKRSQGLFSAKLIPQSDFDQAHAAYDIAVAQLSSAEHQVEMAGALRASAGEELAKTTIFSPISGTVSKLNSQLGERVLGTVQNVGTEIMTIADLGNMEARVDISEVDVVLIAPGQKARLEVDAFKDRKFTGLVTAIANSSKDSNPQNPAAASAQSQEATKFEVRIHVDENESFRPGMSISAEIETRSRSNVLVVPLASVTARPPKRSSKKDAPANGTPKSADTNSTASVNATNAASSDRKAKDANKPVEVVFAVEGDRVKMVPVKIGICDDSYWEITAGLSEGQEIVSGGYRAISRDLDDGKKIRKGNPTDDKPGT